MHSAERSDIRDIQVEISAVSIIKPRHRIERFSSIIRHDFNMLRLHAMLWPAPANELSWQRLRRPLASVYNAVMGFDYAWRRNTTAPVGLNCAGKY